MKQKKNVSDKSKKMKLVPSLISKKINFRNIQIPQIISIKGTKNKIGSALSNILSRRETMKQQRKATM